MKNFFYPVKVLVAGLSVSHFLFTILVFLSNKGLYQKLVSINNAGYITVPNSRVMSSLCDFGPAFFGAFFFTVTAGAGITLTCLLSVWLWDRLFLRKKYFLYFCSICWAGLFIMLNINRLNFSISLCFTLISAVSVLSAFKWLPKKTEKRLIHHAIMHFIPVLLLFILWGCLINKTVFVDFRNSFLFSSKIGAKLNSFYYRYTLYPANIIKSHNQRILKTCSIKTDNHIQLKKIERRLLKYDFLNIPDLENPDMAVYEKDGGLIFKCGNKTIVSVSGKEFFRNPWKYINQFSKKSDRYTYFKYIVMISLVIAFPTAIYIMLHFCFNFAAGCLLKMNASPVIATCLCCIIGAVILISLYLFRTIPADLENVDTLLLSANLSDRVSALRLIYQEKKDILNYPDYLARDESDHVPERFWLVKNLGQSRNRAVDKYLLAFINDSHINVACNALYAVGKRGNRKFFYIIKKRIMTSEHWYEQRYAYMALRDLGWKQKRSH